MQKSGKNGLISLYRRDFLLQSGFKCVYHPGNSLPIIAWMGIPGPLEGARERQGSQI